jgi:hypothetical protein
VKANTCFSCCTGTHCTCQPYRCRSITKRLIQRPRSRACIHCIGYEIVLVVCVSQYSNMTHTTTWVQVDLQDLLHTNTRIPKTPIDLRSMLHSSCPALNEQPPQPPQPQHSTSPSSTPSVPDDTLVAPVADSLYLPVSHLFGQILNAASLHRYLVAHCSNSVTNQRPVDAALSSCTPSEISWCADKSKRNTIAL